MYQYDEEIRDILTEHGVRTLKRALTVIGLAAVFCLGVFVCRDSISNVPVKKIPLIIHNATVAASRATAALATASRDAWVETTSQQPAPVPPRP